MKWFNFLCMCFIFFVSSCVPSAQIQNEWAAPEPKIDSTKMFQKILFVALLKDDPTRRMAENKLVAEVKGRGVASYNYLSLADTRSNESLIGDRLRQDGFDGVVVMRFAEVDKSKSYTGGSYPSYYNSWYGYYSSTYPAYSDPKYFSPGGFYTIETNVYSLQKNKLVWTGVTSAVNITDINKMLDHVISMIKQRMKSQGLIK